MALTRSALFPSLTCVFSTQSQQRSTPRRRCLCPVKMHVSGGSKAVTEPSKTTFGFKNLTETLWVDVQRADARLITASVAAKEASMLANVAIRVELSNGCVGWGEAPCFSLVENMEACNFLNHNAPATLNLVLHQIGRIFPDSKSASVRAGFEMALIDAVANSIGVPLWRFFGGASNSIETAVRIPVASPAKASDLASKYCKQGFKTFRISLQNETLEVDMSALQAIRESHPDCSLIIDANGEFSSSEAITILQRFQHIGVIPVLFEQPAYREDYKGLSNACKFAWENYGIPVSADETCTTLLDVQRVIDENLANVINIKLAKFGVLGALQAIELAKNSGLYLMIDGMVETRLATGFAGHLAAGAGCFKYVGLDAPFLLAEDPVVGGYEVSGAVYKFNNARGQGGFLNWDRAVGW